MTAARLVYIHQPCLARGLRGTVCDAQRVDGVREAEAMQWCHAVAADMADDVVTSMPAIDSLAPRRRP